MMATGNGNKRRDLPLKKRQEQRDKCRDHIEAEPEEMVDKKPIKKPRSKRLRNQQAKDNWANTSKKLQFLFQSRSASDEIISSRMEKAMGLKKQKPNKFVNRRRQMISKTVNVYDGKDLAPKKGEERGENLKNPRNISPKKRSKSRNPQPGLPNKFKDFIENVEGREVRLVTQKRLKPEDLNEKHRFSIPLSLVRTEFLREDEKRVLQRSEGKINVEMIAIDPSRKPVQMLLGKWERGIGSSYTLNEKWMEVVYENGLEVGDLVQLWCFRKPSGHLHFALVRVAED
ncbi:B3 domain-containing protein At2g31720-like [Dillenia turbinata]|uniref:B3 domain-containing protein At2g31720-like n=1 Tax=Dillenia turbinata TaxID=194707 RepID=A0AAN8Z5T0_9MAGN